MSVDHVSKKYQQITDDIVLFNEEYYLSVWLVPLSSVDGNLEDVFTTLFSFASPDIEVEIDVSEEGQGVWYLQLLVQNVLTLPTVAEKRLARGTEALQQFLEENNVVLSAETLQGEEMFHYIKRYNPGVNLA